MKRMALGIVLLSAFHVWAQEVPQLTLSQVVSEGLKSGPASAIRSNTLDTSRLTVDAASAHRLFSMNGTLNYGLSDSSGDAAVVSRTNPLLSPLATSSASSPFLVSSGTNLTNPPLPQTIGGSLTAVSAGTALTTSASRTFQQNTDGSSTDQGALSLNLSQTLWDGY